MSYETKNIRNIALLGHGNTGKTSLAESMLYITGAIDRLGKVSEPFEQPVVLEREHGLVLQDYLTFLILKGI